MALYLKKVDAVQFVLTEEDIANLKNRKPVYFENGQVKHIGGDQHIAVIQYGETLLKVHLTQWLVKHPDGQLQIFWPDQFGQLFIKGSDSDSISVPLNSFKAKSFN